MSVTYRVATLEDVDDLVRLHKLSQPDTFWAKVGGKSSRLFFSHFVQHPKEHALVAELAPHGVVAFTLATTRPSEYERAFYKENMGRLIAMMILDLITRPSRVKIIFDRLSSTKKVASSDVQSHNIPPVLDIDPFPKSLAFDFLFVVDPVARGNRIGAKILEKMSIKMGELGYEWTLGRTTVDNIASQIGITRAGYVCVDHSEDTLLYLYPYSEDAKAIVAAATA